MTRYRCVTARKAEGFNVAAACAAAGVSTSAFYDWAAQAAGPTEAEWDEAHLIDQIRAIHGEFEGTYGQPRARPLSCAARAGWSTTSGSSG